jgi:2,3,4,5-tetrahydropyridine-2-carboxylate N-succinyltransferase
MSTALQTAIEAAWDARDTLTITTKGEARDAVEAAIEGLDNGSFRVAEKLDGSWTVNQWLKKAVLLSFRLNDNVVIENGSARI